MEITRFERHWKDKGEIIVLVSPTSQLEQLAINELFPRTAEKIMDSDGKWTGRWQKSDTVAPASVEVTVEGALRITIHHYKATTNDYEDCD